MGGNGNISRACPDQKIRCANSVMTDQQSEIPQKGQELPEKERKETET
jgi:hypothetical protein